MRARTAALSVLVLVASALPAGAQIPLGPEFRVDTGGADEGFFYSPTPRTVAIAEDGRFVIAWRTPGPEGYDVAARRFDSAGRARGPEFPVNSYTSGSVYGHSVASDDAGNFVVVWDGEAPFAGAILGRRFDAAGVGLGSEFLVNDATSAGLQPFMAMTPAGEFAVVWKSSAGITARRYDAAGVPLSGEFVVNTSTTNGIGYPSVAYDGAGNFVVVWGGPAGPVPGYVRGQRFNAAGAPQGAEFVVNSGTAPAYRPRVGRARDGAFAVAWESGNWLLAQRFDANAAPLGPEFTVTTFVFDHSDTDLAVDTDGDLVFVWNDQYRILGRRFEAAGTAGPQFTVATHTAYQMEPSVATDPAGNFVVSWRAGVPNVSVGAYARRFAGGLMGTALSVDASAGPASDGNGVLEAGETIAVAPSWLNANFTAQTFTGTAASFTGPGTPGDPTYAIADGAASYGTVASGATSSCAPDCCALGVTVPSTRPAPHWDATLREEIAPANLGGLKNWALQVGDSFADVPRSSAFYPFIETILHYNVTGGCTATTYCPASPTTREQLAVFVLVAKEGSEYAPPACTTPMFNDVPASSPFCRWIEELARRGVVAGCGGGNYCPTAAVSRQEMAVFVLATKEPGVTPPACGAPMFNDVPASSPFCPWIEELARRGVVTGCGGGAYCPTAPVTREQMGVFLSAGFGLLLYGP